MSNEKQLTPIGEAIKHTKDRIRDLKGLQEEKTGFERGQLSHRIHELELQQKMLRSLLPKEEESMIMLADKAQQYSYVSGSEDPRVEFYYTPKELFNETFNNPKVCPSCGYPLFKRTFENFERCQGCNETFKTESDEQ